jgi:hypothetical protein
LSRPDLRPLPLEEGGNRERARTLDYDAADAPMLRYALSVAVATAMMCGGRESIRRLRHYEEQVKGEAHPDAKLLDRETDLCEIAIIASAIPTWTVHRVKENEWSRRFRVVVTVGTRTFKSDSIVEEDEFERIAAMVESIVPMSCARGDRDDVIGSPWNI